MSNIVQFIMPHPGTNSSNECLFSHEEAVGTCKTTTQLQTAIIALLIRKINLIITQGVYPTVSIMDEISTSFVCELLEHFTQM